MRLTVTLVYDDEWKGYVAEVPELPGCMSQGRTIESALENVREAIGLYLEASPDALRRPSKPTLTTSVEV